MTAQEIECKENNYILCILGHFDDLVPSDKKMLDISLKSNISGEKIHPFYNFFPEKNDIHILLFELLYSIKEACKNSDTDAFEVFRSRQIFLTKKYPNPAFESGIFIKKNRS